VRRDTGSAAGVPARPLGDVLEFLRLVWAVDHALEAKSKRMKRALGVTGPQRLVIRIVRHDPGIAAGGIARLLHVHPSTLTGILKRLERQGLIRRKRDASDGRRWLVALTARGRRVAGARRGTVEEAVARVLASTPRSQLDGARRVLTALATALAAPR
jgi:MarR family transcriptional regulator, organic hydroperoxide resistance regulator